MSPTLYGLYIYKVWFKFYLSSGAPFSLKMCKGRLLLKWNLKKQNFIRFCMLDGFFKSVGRFISWPWEGKGREGN